MVEHKTSEHRLHDLMPPLWVPWGVYRPGDRAIFGGHIWVKCRERGLWERA